MNYISSQRFLDEEIVASKIENGDFYVLVSPSFCFEGEELSVILDGHHSFVAARESGNTPQFKIATVQDHDAVALLDHDLDQFLAAVHQGDDFFYIDNGQLVF